MKQSKQDRLPVFCERLTELLTKQGDMNISYFAKVLGLSRQTLSFYLSGERLPDARMLSMICQKCNVSADWLLGLSKESPLEPSAKIAADYIGLSVDATERIHVEKERMQEKGLKEVPIIGIVSMEQEALRSIDDLLSESIIIERSNRDDGIKLSENILKQIKSFDWVHIAGVNLSALSFDFIRKAAERIEENAREYVIEKIGDDS